jgi:hypothetical protein
VKGGLCRRCTMHFKCLTPLVQVNKAFVNPQSPMPIESLDFLVVRHASTLPPSLYLPALIENIWLAVTRRKKNSMAVRRRL